MGYFILGDFTYALKSFLLVPFHQPAPKSAEENFNFFHSSARINVECTFAEIHLRWGISWKRLKFSLDKIPLIIEGAMQLHKFLLDYRETKFSEDKMVLFQNGLNDNGINSIVVGTDSIRGRDISQMMKENVG